MIMTQIQAQFLRFEHTQNQSILTMKGNKDIMILHILIYICKSAFVIYIP